MIHSMTAFTRKQSNDACGELVWEIRSLNHRYLDTSLRLPDVLRGIETTARAQLSKRLSRGKLEASLRFKPTVGGDAGALTLDPEVLRSLATTLDTLGEQIPHHAPPDLLQVLQWPGLLVETRLDLKPVEHAALALLDTALDDLIDNRRREGAKLGEIIHQRLQDISKITSKVRASLPQLETTCRQRLEERIAQLAETLDPNRLEQEIAILLQKLDIAEELDRLDVHVSEARRVLDSDQPVGRRLDFLMQEFNRETNTMGSKSGSELITKAAMELKVLIEQMREQVQNIE